MSTRREQRELARAERKAREEKCGLEFKKDDRLKRAEVLLRRSQDVIGNQWAETYRVKKEIHDFLEESGTTLP